MAENLGAIRYEVEVETASMLKAEGVVNKSISNQVKEFDKADKAVDSFVKTQKLLGRTINEAGQVINQNGKIVATATERYNKLKTASDQINTSVTGTAAAVNGQLNQALTNTSYQIQDIAVQLAGGQNPFLVMAQQIPQLLVGFGALAAGVGAAVAVLGGLYLAFGDSTTSAEKLEKSIEQVKAAMTLGADGVINYSDELKELNRVSENLTKIKLAIALTDNQKALNGIKSEFADLRSSLFDFQEDSDEAAKRLTGLTSKASDITGLASSLQALTKVTDDDSRLALLDGIEERLLSLRNADGSFPTSDLKAFANEFFTLSNNTRQAVEQNKLLKQSQDGLIDSSNNTAEAFEQQRIALKTQRIELEQGQSAAYKYALLMSGEFTSAQIQSLVAMKETNDGLIEQDRLRKQASDALEEEIDGYIRLGEEVTKAEERKTAAAKRERDRLAQRGSTVGLTQVQTIEMRYENDLKALQAYFGEDYALKEEYANREIELQRQKQEAIRQAQAETNQFMQDAFGNLDTQIAGTMAQVIVGAKDGKEAMRGLANTMLTQVVGAAVQYGVELVKNKVLGQALATSEQANIAATTATGIASQQAATTSTVAAAATTATAAAPAAALTSTFSFGSAAVIGGAALLGTLAIAKMMGGRQYGGPVSQGMYRVNETGVPEIYSHGGKDYLMNTKNANIKPLEQGGMGGMQVIVNNNTPYEVFVTQDQAANIANIQIGREASKAAKGQGTLLRGVMAGTNTQKRARS